MQKSFCPCDTCEHKQTAGLADEWWCDEYHRYVLRETVVQCHKWQLSRAEEVNSWRRVAENLEQEKQELIEQMTNDRKNITQPADWWAAFEEAASKEGLTLSAWIGEACKARLPVKVAKKLTERPPANRPKKVTE